VKKDILAWVTKEGTWEYKDVKSIAIPLHAWTVPEGSRRLKLSDFKTVST
jgi:hypothetical protein